MIAKAEPQHRGRFQAQGGKGRGIEESESWAQLKALTAPDGHALLTMLHDRLVPVEQKLRNLAFDQAHNYIDVAAQSGGVSALMKKSFPNGKLRKTDPRVDIEVNKGRAFIPPPDEDENQ